MNIKNYVALHLEKKLFCAFLSSWKSSATIFFGNFAVGLRHHKVCKYTYKDEDEDPSKNQKNSIENYCFKSWVNWKSWFQLDDFKNEKFVIYVTTNPMFSWKVTAFEKLILAWKFQCFTYWLANWGWICITVFLAWS